ncbi:MAG: DUF4434 domain-containing protein, partial [Oscillospiraceae bacterium]|nr:DUF4434 domain-containing protein [Oscillospiraceae bacterium]
MKKRLAFLLALVLCLVACACSPNKGGEETDSCDEKSSEHTYMSEKTSGTENSFEGESSFLLPEDESKSCVVSVEMSVPEISGKPEITDKPTDEIVTDRFDDGISYPHVIGSFMQPGTFEGYSKTQMTDHLKAMKEVGIEILILQWSFETDDDPGKVITSFFSDSFSENEKAKGFIQYHDLVDVILAAADEVGVKVFIGLNWEPDWHTNSEAFQDKSYFDKFIETGLKGAKQLYDLYKIQYPESFYGWYFPPEYWNMNISQKQVDNAAYWLKSFRHGLYKIDPAMPMMISPFVISSWSSPSEAEKMWKGILAHQPLRAGDIFCSQDAIGSAHITLDQLDSYFKALKAAIDTAPGVRFWANSENFNMIEGGATAPLNRLVMQMEIADKYVEHHVTFAYSHYQHPDMGKAGHHEAYKHYYQTGKVPTSKLLKPEFDVTAKSGGIFTELSAKIENTDKTVWKLVIEKNG